MSRQQHVAQDAAADAGDRAEQDRGDRSHAEVERLRRARDQESNSDGVEDQNAALHPLPAARPPEEADQPGRRRPRPDSASRGTSPAGSRSAGHG